MQACMQASMYVCRKWRSQSWSQVKGPDIDSIGILDENHSSDPQNPASNSRKLLKNGSPTNPYIRWPLQGVFFRHPKKYDPWLCWTRRHVLLLSKETCLLLQHEKKVFLFDKKTCLLVQQEDMSSFSTRRHVFLFNKKTCLLVQY